MKRSILTIILLAVAISVNAQLISSSSLVITKAKLPPVESGYEQSVDASYAMMMTGANNLEANISYIGGYRFNGHIFLGAGIGISIMDSVKESYETHSVVTGGNGDGSLKSNVLANGDDGFVGRVGNRLLKLPKRAHRLVGGTRGNRRERAHNGKHRCDDGQESPAPSIDRSFPHTVPFCCV